MESPVTGAFEATERNRASVGETTTFFSLVEASVFEVFHALSDSRRQRHRTRPLVLTLTTIVDFLSLMAVSLPASAGWEGTIIGSLRGSAVDLFAPVSVFAFIIAYTVAALLVLACLACTAWVAYSADVDRHDGKWVVLLLERLLGFLSTIGFIPVCYILLMPHSCSALRTSLGDGNIPCSLSMALLSVTSVLLAAFVPFMLSAALMCFGIEPTGGFSASSTGRHHMMHTAVRFLAVAIATQSGSPGAEANLRVAVLQLAVFGGMTALIAIRLPFYDASANCLWSALYGGTAMCAVFSFVLALNKFSESDMDIIGFVFLPACALACVGGWLLPTLRLRWLHRQAKAVLNDKTRSVLSKDDIVAPALPTDDTGAIEFPSDSDTESDDTAVKRRVHRRHETASVGDPLYVSFKVQNLHYFSYEHDVECTTRFVLQDPTRRSHFQFLSPRLEVPPQPTAVPKYAIKLAERLYLAGLTQYPDSTLIRTQYSLFLATYKGNAQRATAVLMSVSSLSPMVDLRFQMFTSSRILGKLRRGDQNGGAMDALGEMSFQRHHNQALSRHTEAVSTMHKLWKALERFDKHSTDVSPLASHLTKASSARSSAEATYRKLLEQYPAVPIALKSYSAFCRDVLNDSALAQSLTQRVDALMLRAPAKRDDGSHSFKSSMKSSTKGTAVQRLVPADDDVRNMSTMRNRLRFVFVLLVAISVTTALLIRGFSGAYLETVSNVGAKGLLRFLTSSGVQASRNLQLAAMLESDDEWEAVRLGGLSKMKTFKDKLEQTYFNTPNSEAVGNYFVTSSLTVQRYVPAPPGIPDAGATNFTYEQPLWEMAHEYIAEVSKLCHMDKSEVAGTAAYTNSRWRYVMDNGYQSLLQGFLKLVSLDRIGNYSMGGYFSRVVVALVAAVIVLVLYLAFYEFVRICLYVHDTKHGIIEVLQALPPAAVRAISRRYEVLDSQIHSFVADIQRAADGHDTDDDFGSDDGNNGFPSLQLAMLSPPARKRHLKLSTPSPTPDPKRNKRKSVASAHTLLSASCSMAEMSKYAAEELDVLASPKSDAMRHTPKRPPMEAVFEVSKSPDSIPIEDDGDANRNAGAAEGAGAAATAAAAADDASSTFKASNAGDRVAKLSATASFIEVPAVALGALRQSSQRLVASGRSDSSKIPIVQSRRRSSKVHPTGGSMSPAASKTVRKANVCSRVKNTSRELRVLWLQFLGLMAAVAALQTGSAWLHSTSLEEVKLGGVAMDYAGQRRYLLNKMTVTTQELLIGDQQMTSTPRLVLQLRADRDWFQRLHRGLRYGDEELLLQQYTYKIDELDQVWFAADPTAFDHADNATSVTSYGGDALIRAYMIAIDNMLSRFEPHLDESKGAMLPSFNKTEAGVLGLTHAVKHDRDYQTMVMLEPKAAAVLHQAVVMRKDYAGRVHAAGSTLEIALIVTNVTVIAALDMLMLTHIFKKLKIEAKRTTELLQILPTQLVEAVPSIKRRFVIQSKRI